MEWFQRAKSFTQSVVSSVFDEKRMQIGLDNLRKPFTMKRSIRNQNEVSLLLAKYLFLNKAKDQNFVFSPLSMHMVLGMIASGASGAARDQLLTYLKSESVEELNSRSSQVIMPLFADGSHLGGPQLSIANGVWVDKLYKLKEPFKTIVSQAYAATVQNVDFRKNVNREIENINKWVSEKTKHLISGILPSPSPNDSTSLVVANAVYFKGAWEKKFNASRTRFDIFNLSSGKYVTVPFMTSDRKQYVGLYDGFKVLKMPYEKGQDKRQFSMYFFLPDSVKGLPALVEKVCSQPGFIEDHLPSKKVRLDRLLVPKFKIDSDFEASGIMRDQGLDLPFKGGLSEMVHSSDDHLVSRIYHKAVIEVKEEGTIAAAATAGQMIRTSNMNPEMSNREFVADHPFLFVIREDKTGALSFIGQVTNFAVVS